MMTFDELKQAFSDAVFPARWETLPPCEEKDIAFLSEEALCRFHEAYPVFGTGFAHILAAARVIRENAALLTCTAYLARAIGEWDVIQEDIAAMTLPAFKEGEGAVGYGLMPLVACVPHIAAAVESLLARGVEEKIIYDTLSYFERAVDNAMKKDVPSFPKSQFSWCQHYLHGIILRIGRLEFHWIDDMYGGNFGVYRSSDGQYRLLAERGSYHRDGHLVTAGAPALADDFPAAFTETDTYYEGNLISEAGLVFPELVKLPKGKWQRVAGYESPVVTVHIPSGPGLTHENIDAAFRDALAVHKRAFSDFKACLFHCHSWLLDTQHRAYLAPDANILKFQGKFIHGTTNTCDMCVFSFLFPGGSKGDLSALAEDSSMQRIVKRLLLAGGHIYEQNGVIPFEWVEDGRFSAGL